MARIRDTTIKSKPRKRYFLGCFGFSWKTSEKKLSQDVVKSSANRKKNRFLSWSRFRMKKPTVKTVPVDTNSPEKPQRITEIVEITAEPDQTVNSRPHKKRHEDSHKIILESPESLDSNTCQKVMTRSRKKEAKRKSISQQGSPERGKKSGLTNKVLSHSASFPAFQVAATATGDSRIKKDKSHQESGETAGKFEPVVGMSIIMVTLIIMVIWGTLCAILCTSAWLYFVPRLRKSVGSNKVGVKNGGLKSDETDLDSEEYKKKVVLEGLLRRSRRNFARVL